MKKGVPAGPAAPREPIRLNKRVLVFIVCLCISFFSWLQINLSRKQLDTIPVRLEFNQLPKSRFGHAVFYDTLQVEVEADGYDLMKYEMQEVKIEYKRLKKNRQPEYYYYLPNNYLKQINRQLGDEFKVVRSLTDTVQLIPSLR